MMEYYSVIKKNETLPFAHDWMELKSYAKQNTSEKDKYDFCGNKMSILWTNMIFLICGI